MWVLFSIDGAIVSPCKDVLRLRTYVQDTKGVGHNYPKWLRRAIDVSLCLVIGETE